MVKHNNGGTSWPVIVGHFFATYSQYQREYSSKYICTRDSPKIQVISRINGSVAACLQGGQNFQSCHTAQISTLNFLSHVRFNT